MTEEADSRRDDGKKNIKALARIVLSHERRAGEQNRGAKLTSWGTES
jgi:hypothetical protein